MASQPDILDLWCRLVRAIRDQENGFRLKNLLGEAIYVLENLLGSCVNNQITMETILVDDEDVFESVEVCFSTLENKSVN